MYEQVEKPKETKNKTVANSVAQKKNNEKQGFGFVDNRPEAIMQRRLHETVNKNQKVKLNHQLETMDFSHTSQFQPKKETGISEIGEANTMQFVIDTTPLLTPAEKAVAAADAAAAAATAGLPSAYQPPTLPDMAPVISDAKLAERTSGGQGGLYTPPAVSTGELASAAVASASGKIDTAAMATLDAEDRMQAAIRHRVGGSVPSEMAAGSFGDRLLPDSEAVAAHRLQGRKDQVKAAAGKKVSSAIAPGAGGLVNAVHTAHQGFETAEAVSGSGDAELVAAAMTLASSKKKKGGSQAVATAGGVGAGAAIGQIAIPVPVLGAVIGGIVGFLAAQGIQKGADELLQNKTTLKEAANIIFTKAHAGDEAALKIFDALSINRDVAAVEDGYKVLNKTMGV